MKQYALGMAIFLFLLGSVPETAALQTPTIPSEDGVYVVVRLSDHAEPGLLPVTAAGGPLWAEVGARAQTVLPSVRSMSSANNQYSINYTSIHPGPCGPSLIRLDGEWQFQERSSLSSLSADARGATSTGCLVHSEIADPTNRMASRIAMLLGTEPILWAVSGDRVTGTFSPAKPVFNAGEDVEILFTMHNPSDAPAVQRMAIGRDNLAIGPGWNFQIRRNGRLVIFMRRGGSTGATSVDFTPGETVTFRIQLQRWSEDITKPGHYTVECTHTEHFSPPGTRLGVRNPGGDQQFTQTVEFDIEP